MRLWARKIPYDPRFLQGFGEREQEQVQEGSKRRKGWQLGLSKQKVNVLKPSKKC